MDFLAVSDPSALRFRRVRVAIGLQWGRFLPTSGEKGPRLLAHRKQLDLMPFYEFVCIPYRIQSVEAVLDRCILQEDHRALWCSIVPLINFGTIEWHQVDRVIPQFGGVQNRPHMALNIDFMHAKDGRGSDQWFLQTYQRWHGFWQPGLRSCLTLHSLLIPAPLQNSFSGRSSPLGGTLSRLIISIVCHLTRSRLRPHRDSQFHIQRDLIGPTQKIRCMPEGYGRRREAAEPVEAARRGVTRRLPTDSRWCQHQSGGIGCGDELTGLPPIHLSHPGDRDPIEYDLPVAAGVPGRAI
ncbi:hypothetical protein PIB30_062668 [Stylosanthes scabra]|uniref:Uncharacterized protein n=1 Tax=Stylosanthes scabra TaxID=79078 RepID=A0ABU6SL69_9FABA|nr:hypothetical protein [Stylosanthes scabra]